MIRNVSERFYSYTRVALLIAFIFGFLAGAAMALEPAVTHQAFGIATWTISLVFTLLAIVERVVSAFHQRWSQIRGGETGQLCRFWINIVVSLTIITMTIVALAIH